MSPAERLTMSERVTITLAVLVSLAVVSCGSDSITRPDSPALITPARGQILDNGCPGCSDPIKWQFEWREVPDASEYHLYVIGETATIPLIDERSVAFSTYSFRKPGDREGRNVDVESARKSPRSLGCLG